MFCFKCGEADQLPETFCRRCGSFLPDPDRAAKKIISPQEHVTANLVLSVLTVVASFTLAVLLFLLIGFREGTHPLIYATGGVLIAIGAWQIQTVWRSWQLRKHFKSFVRPEIGETKPASAGKLLEVADFENAVPASITEKTTRQLSQVKSNSPQSEH